MFEELRVYKTSGDEFTMVEIVDQDTDRKILVSIPRDNKPVTVNTLGNYWALEEIAEAIKIAEDR